MSSSDEITRAAVEYYTDKFREHGATPRGVDWNSKESQQLRFAQLACLLPDVDQEFSLLDYGCGYGALFDYLQPRYSQMHYTGYDRSKPMIEAAIKRTGLEVEWSDNLSNDFTVDYLLASGMFNVRLEFADDVWEKYILQTLDEFHKRTRSGFAFNMLTSYSDPEYMQDYLFYAESLKFFHHCKANYSHRVALLHDYPLYEFTILVRK